MKQPVPAEHLYRWILACAIINIPILAPALAPPMQLAGPGLLVACCHGFSLRLSGVVLSFGAALGLILAAYTGQYPLVLWVVQGAGLAALFLALLERQTPQPLIFLAGVIFLCATFILALFLASGGNLSEAYEQVLQMVSKDLDQNLALYKQAIATPNTVGLDEWILDVKRTVIAFFPGILFCMFIATSFANIMLARWSLHRRSDIQALKDGFATWHFPESLVWGIILAGAVCLFGKGQFKVAADNVLLGLCGLYSIQGLAIISHYFSWFKLPAVVRGIFYLLILIQWYGLIFIALLGIFDTWFDFRSRIESDAGTENKK